MRRVKGTAVRRPARRLLAQGDGWSAWDVVCDAGPRDRRFEEQLAQTCIAIVAAGTFQYRAAAGRELMTPGCLLLGNAGQHFECGHEHGVGDRCISFSYDQGYFDGIAAEAGVPERNARFSILRVPAVRELSSLIVRASIGLSESGVAALNGQYGPLAREGETLASPLRENTSRSNAGMAGWEEIGIELVGRALALAGGCEPSRGSLPAAE